jgi:hypothetical protein
MKRIGVLMAACLAGLLIATAVHAQRKTENVILVMTDGLRWQEVFSGAEVALMNKERGGVADIDALKQAFWRETPQARREVLMPFFWSVIAKQGQVFGNQSLGSIATITNGKNFSYPGYNETLTGFADARIDSNAKRPNPNVTVFEWLNKMPRYRGKVAAFAAWDVFPFIFNRERAGFLVNAGYELLTDSKMTPQIELLNRLKQETPRKWGGEPYDSFTFYTALEYLKVNKPRVFFLSLGETDEWAHEGRYDEYLVSAQRFDSYLKMLWEAVQSMPQYRNKTTLIIATDHGRGDAPEGWKHHAAAIPGSENVWIAVIGPDTPALGERSRCAPVTQNQIAATLAAFLGEDYVAAEPKAGKPIADVTSPR